MWHACIESQRYKLTMLYCGKLVAVVLDIDKVLKLVDWGWGRKEYDVVLSTDIGGVNEAVISISKIP